MDVGAPNNFERMQALYGGDLEALRRDIAGVAYDDARVVAEIGEVYRRTGTCSTRTAPSRGSACRRCSPRIPTRKGVFLATAHPAKFREVVEPAIGEPVPLPRRSERWRGRECDRAARGLRALEPRSPATSARNLERLTRVRCLRATLTLPPRARHPAGTRGDPRPLQVGPRRHLPRLGRMVGSLPAARGGRRRLQARSRARSRTAPRQLLASFRAMDEMGALSYRVWYFAVAAVRRGSAQQRGQREAPARPDPVRAAAAGQLVVQPGGARHPARHHPRLDGGERRSCRLPVRDREPVPRAGARARRGGRAADVVRRPVQQHPVRQLRRADDGRHEVSVDHAGTAASR